MARLSFSRAVLASAACAAVLLAAFAVFGTRTTAGAQGGPEQGLIGILSTGFNPEVCRLNRNGEAAFRFVNRDTVVHRVISKGVDITGKPIFDTGDLQPGQISKGATFAGGSTLTYYEASHAGDPNWTVIIDVGLHANQCKELPPTPTPTNTPTITPTPTKTPRPTMTPTPSPTVQPTPDLRKAVIPALAKDEDY